MKLYKVLDKEGKSCHGGEAEWSLPWKKDGIWQPGEWMPTITGAVVPCENGYHLCREQDLIHWLNEGIYETEYEGEKVESKDKIVVRKCRLTKKCENWNEEAARLFACWCIRNTPLQSGKTVWDLLSDKRSRRAVEIAEQYARGEATEEERAAAGDAAWAAARDAARDAAWDAARAAAGDAAWDAQTKELVKILEGNGIK